MSILSDREIIELCQVNTFLLINKHLPNLKLFINRDNFKDIIDKHSKDDLNNRYGLQFPELLVNLERAFDIVELDQVFDLPFGYGLMKLLESTKPMISPFVDGQVRIKRRLPTDIEKMCWESSRHGEILIQQVSTSINTLTPEPIKIPDTFVSDNPDIGLEIKEKIISYGTSSYGYDVRIANEFKIFTNVNTTVLDPKNFNDGSFVDFVGDVCIIPPNSFVLARTLEYFHMPRDVTGLVLGKSTYARLGISCLATPIEAGWCGEIVLEFANTTPLPVKLYANEGAAQLLFFKGDKQCSVSYADRGGKYQNQTGITTAKV